MPSLTAQDLAICHQAAVLITAAAVQAQTSKWPVMDQHWIACLLCHLEYRQGCRTLSDLERLFRWAPSTTWPRRLS